MESLTLSSVSTIMGIVRDILSAVETASQNKSRCKKVAERVRCIKDILEAIHAAPAQDGTTWTSTDGDEDAATRRLLKRLEGALSHALEMVRRCNRSSSFLIRSVVAGGRMADPLEAVEAEIDRCILDIALANSLRIARLETLLVRRENNNMAVADSTEAHNEEDDDDDNTTASEKITTAIGVPVCTAVTAVEHEQEHGHEMVPPPPAYGYYGYCWSCRSYHYHSYYYYWRDHGCTCDCRDDGDAGATFYHTHQYSSYRPSMFSDDDPSSCSIM